MAEPLFEQIFLNLKENIDSGSWKPGALLPTENQLTAEYGVSRITAKRALDELKRIGYIDRKRGSGSHVRADFQMPAQQFSPKIVTLVLPFSEQLDSPSEVLSGLNPILTENNI